MINSPIYIFDNIGSYFSYQNDKFLIGSSLPGYKSLNIDHINAHIPYLVRNVNNSKVLWEIGIGKVVVVNSSICVERVQVVKSSNNDQLVDFSAGGTKSFYIFANEYNFNTGFNNVILKNNNFIADSVRCVYIVDTSDNASEASLPDPSKCAGLELKFKTVGSGSNDLIIKKSNNEILTTLTGSDKFTQVISTGTDWVELKDQIDAPNIKAMGLSDGSYTISSVEGAGDDRSLQFNNDGTIDGTDVYWSSNGQLLFGSSSSSSAHSIIPSSGNSPTIINNDGTNSNFLVKGSGLNNSLFFTYDGKLGLNIPSGATPQTVLHLINNNCKEGIRLENRSSCYPANITLYHKPASSIDANSVVSSLSLAAKNNLGNKVEYGKLQSKALVLTEGSTKGQIELLVDSSGSGVSVLQANPNAVTVGYTSGNALVINNQGASVLGYSNNNITVTNNAININTNNISMTGIFNATKINIGSGSISTLSLPNISPNKLLMVNSSGVLTTNDSSFSIASIPSGRILTTSASGVIVGSLTPEQFFITEKSLSWNQYPARTANVCLKQIAPIDPIPVKEFAIGDQVAIETDTDVFYRIVKDIEIENNNIISILVDSNITVNTVANVKVYSITQGGYLKNTRYVKSGNVSDSTANILSIRPQTDTVFNNLHKDINFLVYGIDNIPALEVFANINQSSSSKGVYTSYNPSTTGVLRIVGDDITKSYYGTYDQGDNVSEWIENDKIYSTDNIEYVAGGSWNSTNANEYKSIRAFPNNTENNKIGFRVRNNLDAAGSAYISNLLDLKFVSVDDMNNPEDTSGLYDYTSSPELLTIPNLGSVPYSFGMTESEITNNQYCKFLNSVALSGDPYSLYNSNMASSGLLGGIARSGSGPYSYSTVSGMVYKPVVYVDYLSALRFINWIDQGAPSGSSYDPDLLNDGAYTISVEDSSVQKKRFQKYGLPSLNEWYKSAYYQPVETIPSVGHSAVTVKRNLPYSLSSGNYASLSVSGCLYSDSLKISNLIDADSKKVSLIKNSGILSIGPSIPLGGSTYTTTISTTGIILATSGAVLIKTPQPLNISGIIVDTLSVKNIINLKPDGNPVTNYPGGVFYSDENTGQTNTYQNLLIKAGSDGSGIQIPNGSILSPLYLDSEKFIRQYEDIVLDPSGVEIKTSFKTPSIQIGEDNPFFSGSILTHNGEGDALWQPATYLNADGVKWTRYLKRSVLVKNNEIVFTEGDLATLRKEFPYTDTIAVVNNETRQISYVKAADGDFIIDGVGSVTPSTDTFYTTTDGLGMRFCPVIPWSTASGVSGVAFAVNRGGYLSMQLEPSAINGFSCESNDPNSPYRFKPSTLNTISIRPDTATTFNTLAERIDFAIYGHKPTQYNRYEENIFAKDALGLPSGLIPAFKVDSHTSNAVSGSLISGVYLSGYSDIGKTLPIGFNKDESAKTCINTKTPYIINSIPSGSSTLALYADLTVNKYIYAEGLITQSIVLKQGVNTFVPNAPLTINASGYLVSQVPTAPASIPDSPTSLVGVEGNSSVSLTWTSPADDGGSPITNYLIEYSANDGGTWTVYNKAPSTDTFANITGLTNGIDYYFRVSAINEIGNGAASEISNQVTPDTDVPGAPTNLQITRQNLQATLSWNSPSNVGSSSVTGYFIQRSSDGGNTWINATSEINNIVAASPKILTGLNNNSRYIFRIRAINSSGGGMYASIASIGTDPYNPPEPVDNNVWDFGKVSFTGVCS